MRKTQKQKFVYKDYFKFIEEWRSGKDQKFKSGDVVTGNKGSTLGVVQFALAEYGFYQVKVRISDKPWEWMEIKMRESHMVKVDQPNPFIYKYSDMIPGPSSLEIDRLNEKFAKADAKRKKERSAKEVEAHIAALEEDMVYKKEMAKVEDETTDKIVPEEDEDVAVVTPIEVDPIEAKREKIISEE